jgi:hypothetical protein
MKMVVLWVVAPWSAIILMIEAANTPETSVNFYQTTWRNNPEDSHLQLQVDYFMTYRRKYS